MRESAQPINFLSNQVVLDRGGGPDQVASGALGGFMSIGRILNTAFGSIFGNLAAMTGIAFLFAGLPRALVTFFQQTAQAEIGTGLVTPAQFVMITVGGFAVAMLFTIVAQGALVRATLAFNRGEPARFGDCLATALRRLLPLIGVAVVTTLACLVATLFLIVPAIILATIWYVAAPLVVAERSGIFGALGRSSELTSGNRFSIFLVLLISLGFALVIFMLSSVLTGMVLAFTISSGDMSGIALPMAAISAVSTTLQTLLTGAIPAATYVELRGLKEGPEVQGLGEIFA